MDYLVDDAALDAAAFLALANSVWPGEYDVEKTRQALGKTLNITAYHQGQLIGCLRILTDGCYFGTITEVLVLPAFQKQGVGSQLLSLARAHTPTLLYFGAKPGVMRLCLSRKNTWADIREQTTLGSLFSLGSYAIRRSAEEPGEGRLQDVGRSPAFRQRQAWAAGREGAFLVPFLPGKARL